MPAAAPLVGVLFSGTLLDPPPTPVAALGPEDDAAPGCLLNGEMSLLSVLGFVGSAESMLDSVAADFAGVEAGAVRPGPDLVSAVVGGVRSEPGSVAAGLVAVDGGI